VAKKQKAKNLVITLVKSTCKAKRNQKLSAKGLGLKRIGHQVTREDNPCTRGMINKISHLVRVEE
jgi:large subunit ribosomal protein L30